MVVRRDPTGGYLVGERRGPAGADPDDVALNADAQELSLAEATAAEANDAAFVRRCVVCPWLEIARGGRAAGRADGELPSLSCCRAKSCRYRFRKVATPVVAAWTEGVVPTFVEPAKDPRLRPILLDLMAVAGPAVVRVAVGPAIEVAVTAEVRSWSLAWCPSTWPTAHAW